MKRLTKIFSQVFLAVVLTLLLPLQASAFHLTPPSPPPAPTPPPVPEAPGDYPEPTDPSVRVHVFVHAPKPSHRQPATAGVCNPTSNDPATYTLAGWHLATNVTYNLNPSSAPSSVRPVFGEVTTDSFTTWRSAVNNKVTFSQGNNTSKSRSSYDRLNIVAFGRTSSSTIGVTYIRYLVATKEVVDVDTILNNRLAWDWTDPITGDPDASCGNLYAYDLQDILVHETGHWLGLDDRYDTESEDLTMYGYGAKGELKKDTLQSGDLTGVVAIYP